MDGLTNREFVELHGEEPLVFSEVSSELRATYVNNDLEITINIDKEEPDTLLPTHTVKELWELASWDGAFDKVNDIFDMQNRNNFIYTITK